MKFFQIVLVAIALVGCFAQANGLDKHAALTPEQMLARVQEFHRPDAGPWAMAGYRIGMHALKMLVLKPYEFDFSITHFSPFKVQYTCMLDGLQAATGASFGKLNLHLVEAKVEELKTEFTTKDGGRLTYTLLPAFKAKYLDVPYSQLAAKAREVAVMPESAIFTSEGVR